MIATKGLAAICKKVSPKPKQNKVQRKIAKLNALYAAKANKEQATEEITSPITIVVL